MLKHIFKLVVSAYIQNIICHGMEVFGTTVGPHWNREEGQGEIILIFFILGDFHGIHIYLDQSFDNPDTHAWRSLTGAAGTGL